MSKRNQIIFFEEGGVEATDRLRKQNEEFCRRMREAVKRGEEILPDHGLH